MASSPHFRFIGNVNIGFDLSLRALANHYHAILFSYGASHDRKLGVPGEDLKGVYSARDFVGWYNGAPEHASLKPDLQSSEEAVVIGQGNVALDVARILLSSTDKLKETDIAAHALATLARSHVRRVRVVGRRGPMQAAFTIKEARELLTLPDVSFAKIDRSLFPPDPPKSLPRTQRRMVELLLKGSSVEQGRKTWSLDFLLSPEAFKSDVASTSLSAIDFRETELQGPDIYKASTRAIATDRERTMRAGLAFRSIGYRSEAIAGMKDLGIRFNERQGIITNDGYGRATRADRDSQLSAAIPGIYCSGWVKRGPAGVIANTMEDAFATAEALVEDWQANRAFLSGTSGWDGVESENQGLASKVVDWNGWLKIDAAEKENGRAQGKSREKFTSIPDMLSVLP